MTRLWPSLLGAARVVQPETFSMASRGLQGVLALEITE
jgi:hypothetical protein